MTIKTNSEDVKDIVDPTTSDDKKVELDSDKGDDKTNNFAALRKQRDDALAEIARLKAEKGETDFSLKADDDSDADDEDEEDSKKESKDSKEESPLKIIFDRDVKEATRQWSKKNKVSQDEWNKIRSKVSLTGKETVSEIYDKIDEAYQALPSVREKRDKELIEKGKKLAMRQAQDDELDSFSGGDSGSLGDDSGQSTKVTPTEKKFLSSFGVTADEQKKIDKEANPNEWSEGPSPTRKFFDGAKG